MPLADDASAELLGPLSEEERFASWHLVRRGGRIASRGAAGAELLEALGHERLARALRGAGPVVECAYSAVAGSRHVLGRLMPGGPAPRRFP